MRKILGMPIIAVLVVTGCASGADPEAQPTSKGPTPPSGAPSVAKPSTAPATTTPPATPKKIRVPGVVGKNHQEAQNIMQAAGLFMLAEEDATGQGRMLILDRNWQVVRQRPKAGTPVTPDTKITLYSKKIGE